MLEKYHRELKKREIKITKEKDDLFTIPVIIPAVDMDKF